jgi:hypothetical protein
MLENVLNGDRLMDDGKTAVFEPLSMSHLPSGWPS